MGRGLMERKQIKNCFLDRNTVNKSYRDGMCIHPSFDLKLIVNNYLWLKKYLNKLVTKS